jgi:hypothetical protein
MGKATKESGCTSMVVLQEPGIDRQAILDSDEMNG